MWAWGKRDQGQCGVPPPAQPEDARKPILDPTPTATAELQGQIVAVTAGEGHSLALDNLGNCYVWGRTREGQAGRVSHVPQHAALHHGVPVVVQHRDAVAAEHKPSRATAG